LRVTDFARLLVFTIWLVKDKEVTDKVTGGPPASVFMPIDSMRMAAAKINNDRRKKTLLKGCPAHEGESGAAREVLFTSQPHTRQKLFSRSN
jgi:hypothetical protein